MKNRFIRAIIVLTLFGAIFGCSSEKPVEVPQKQRVIPLSLADKEKVAAFRNEMVSLENLSDKTLKLAGKEIMNLAKGGEFSMNLSDLAGKAGSECRQTCEALAKKAVPETLPPEIKANLSEAKDGLMAGYKAYGESFAAINSLITEKKPLALIEYKRKSSQANDLIAAANSRLEKALGLAGIAAPRNE